MINNRSDRMKKYMNDIYKSISEMLTDSEIDELIGSTIIISKIIGSNYPFHNNQLNSLKKLSYYLHKLSDFGLTKEEIKKELYKSKEIKIFVDKKYDFVDIQDLLLQIFKEYKIGEKVKNNDSINLKIYKYILNKKLEVALEDEYSDGIDEPYKEFKIKVRDKESFNDYIDYCNNVKESMNLIKEFTKENNTSFHISRINDEFIVSIQEISNVGNDISLLIAKTCVDFYDKIKNQP